MMKAGELKSLLPAAAREADGHGRVVGAANAWRTGQGSLL